MQIVLLVRLRVRETHLFLEEEERAMTKSCDEPPGLRRSRPESPTPAELNWLSPGHRKDNRCSHGVVCYRFSPDEAASRGMGGCRAAGFVWRRVYGVAFMLSTATYKQTIRAPTAECSRRRRAAGAVRNSAVYPAVSAGY